MSDDQDLALKAVLLVKYHLIIFATSFSGE